MRRKNVFLWIFLIIISIVLMTSCSSASTTTTATTQTSNNSQTTTTNTSGNSISIENFKFVPETLTIKAGTTVVWTNNDSVTHNIKSADFNSPSIAAGKPYEFKFDKVGTYDYSCGIHPAMTGKIIVQ
jgi:plastocyanin